MSPTLIDWEGVIERRAYTTDSGGPIRMRQDLKKVNTLADEIKAIESNEP